MCFSATYLQHGSDDRSREIPENATLEEHQGFETSPESLTAENDDLPTPTKDDFSEHTRDDLAITEPGLAYNCNKKDC